MEGLQRHALSPNQTCRGRPLVKVYAPHISVERELEASPERVWDLLTDTTKWPWWGPSVRRVSCSERYIREGSLGEVVTPIGLRFPFVVTEYVHGYFWAWKVAGIRATGHRLIAFSATRCTIAIEMPVYWLPYTIICRIALKRMDGVLRRSSGKI
jgi:hypothetical protein